MTQEIDIQELEHNYSSTISKRLVKNWDVQRYTSVLEAASGRERPTIVGLGFVSLLPHINEGLECGAHLPRYGKHDQLGTLNRLTKDIVANAATEIKTGIR